ncbi:MAG TPA: PAS domain S-box protein [Pyrinomonadaceae bacterium]|nr:PAS domain S-box protein [Pyrinomonadaceae bacterium]
MSDSSKHRDLTTATAPPEDGFRQREMQAALASLRESNQTLEAIIHASPLAIITLDPDGIVKMWNSAAERIYGWSEEEVLGRPLPTVPLDRQEEMRQNHQRALAGSDFKAYETERLRKDGTQISVSISTAPLTDSEGRLSGVVALVEDITERKRAEREKSQLAAEVETQRHRLDAIIKSVPGVVWEAWGEPDESNQRINFVSDYVEKLLGYTVEEWLSTPNFWLTIVHPEDREIAARTAVATFESGVIGSNQFRWMTKDGRAVWVEAQSVAIMDAEGRPVGMRGVTMDITERKEAGEALRRSEERYRAFVEQSNEPIWRFEIRTPIPVNLSADEQIERFYATGYLAECNDVMARMYGYASASELIGVPLEALLPRTPANLDYLRAAILSGYRLTDVESQELDREGRTVYFLNNLVGIVEGGMLLRVWGTQRDITERKRAEEELRRWEQIFQHAGWGVAMGNPADGTLKAINPAFARMHGYTVEELIGKPLADTFAPEARAQLDAHVRAVAERGHHIYESIHIRKDGTRFPVLADVTAFKDERGNVVYRAANIQDITERKRAEEAARFLGDATTMFTSSLDYELTLESVARLAVPYVADYCLVHMLEDDGSIRRMIVAHQDPAREAAWRDMQRRFPLDINTPHTIAKVLRTGKADLFSDVSDELMQQEIRNPVEIRMLKEFDIKSSMIVPLAARGRTIGALTFISSESARHYTEDDLSLAQELARRAALAIDNARLYRRAQEANRAKDEFLATLSHELRTPLTPIIGWVHMMDTGQLAEGDIKHGLAVIGKNSQSLSRLINDLLDMSAILSGKMRIDTLPVALDPAVKEAIETVRPQAAKHDIKIELAPCAGLEEVLVTGDRTRLVQVFWNLLTNAVKFSPAGSRVKVVCEIEGGSVRMNVEDEGEGIRPEFLPHVFERFRQQDMSTTKMHGGLGIGLALVKSFVEAHGGTVAASSAGEGRGSRFTVTLPLLQTQAAATYAPDDPAADATCEIESACHALLIEDAPDTLEMLRVAFEVRGFRTSACATPEEALAIAANEHFDIIISDIGLPNIDGYELLKRLRNETPRLRDVPALALTGYAAQKDVDAALAAGFSAHLAKPFDPATLAATVDALLNRQTSEPPDANQQPDASRS